MKVVAKFVVNTVTAMSSNRYNQETHGYEKCEVRTVKLSPVTSGSEENKKFFALTPGGSIELSCANLEAAGEFELDKEYYVTFEKAEPAAPVEAQGAVAVSG